MQWLRGWVKPQAVDKELKELKRHCEFTRTCAACYKVDLKCVHPPATAMEKMRGLLLISTYRPLIILLLLCTVGQLSGTYAVRPYLVLIFKAYGSPISPNNATTVLSVCGILGTIVCVSVVKIVGKRNLFVYGLLIISIPKLTVGKKASIASIVIQRWANSLHI